jgi:TatD DNase family protein
MLFDSHAHLNFASFQKDADEIIQRSLDNDTWIINVGSQLSTSRRAIELAQKNSQGVYAAVGLHPIHVSEVGAYSNTPVHNDEEYLREKYAIDDLDKVVDEIKKLAKEDKVVAIGEVGLDYFHFPASPPDKGDLGGLKNKRDNPPYQGGIIREWQKEYFKAFLSLAAELNKPLILHCRGDKNGPEKAYEDLLQILQDNPPTTLIRGATRRLPPDKGGKGGLRGVIHCFGANLEIARRFIDLGFKIGFTGIVTFKNAKELQEVAANIALENILIETDCPYLAPNPFRGQRNEPIYVKYIAQKIAEIKSISLEKVAEVTVKNTRELFGI